MRPDMRQALRSAVRQTRVRTVAGLTIGWLQDVELDLSSGQVFAIAVVATRWWRFRPVWIPWPQVVRWDPGCVTVEDAWAHPERARSEPSILPAQVPSCYVDRS